MNTIETGRLQPIPTTDYQYILFIIKDQIPKRSKLIAKRTAIITWPALIYIGIFSFLQGLNEATLRLLMIATPFILVYVLLFSHLFSIEQTIWIDSYFDGKDLEPSISLKIARKLFWKTLSIRMVLFIRYYLLPTTLLILALAYFCYLVFQPNSLAVIIPDVLKARSENPNLAILLIYFTVIAILSWVYIYYISIKLRYVWFIVLDNYGNPYFSTHELLTTMRQLNNISKSDSFKKSLLIHIGADTVKAVADNVIWAGLSAINKMGKSGKIFSGVSGGYATEVTNQISSYSKKIGDYILYRSAHLVMTGSTQQVNEHVYRLQN